jgi:hypothetical protein
MTKSEKDMLDKLISEIRTSQASHGDKLDRVVASVENLREVLLGDGSEQKPGLHMRVDRLERNERLKSKMLWTVATGTFGLVLKTIWSWVRS